MVRDNSRSSLSAVRPGGLFTRRWRVLNRLPLTWTQKLAHVDTMKDGRVFGLFPEFREFLKPDVVSQATADLRLITSEVVTEMTKEIPKEWDVKREALDALVDLVVGRATFVAETITSRIWPQGSLFSEDEAGSPEK